MAIKALSRDVQELAVMSVSVGHRITNPNDRRVKAMAESIASDGQLNPILVRNAAPVSGKKAYYVVCGATRLKAMRLIGKETIRAIVVGGMQIDYEIAEIAENIDRNDIKGAERKALRARLNALRAQQLGEVPADEKGGRGKRGGIREAARKLGIPRSTAQDLMKKVAGNIKTRPLSPDATPQEASSNVVPLKPKFSNEPVDALDALCRMAEAAVAEAATIDSDVCPTCGRPWGRNEKHGLA